MNKSPPPTTTTTTKTEQNEQQQQQQPLKRRRRTRQNSTGVQELRSKHSSLWELAGAMFVYGMCISLPTILGVMVRVYQNTYIFGGGNDSLNQTTSSWASSFSLSSTPIIEPKTPWYRRSSSSTSNSSYQTNNDETQTSYSNVFLTVLQRWAAAYLQTNTALSDVQFVIMTSLVLALFRVLLIHFLVPKYIAPTRGNSISSAYVPSSVRNLVRCKSTHLLSATEYHFDTMSNFNTTEPMGDGGIVASPRRFGRDLSSVPQMLPEGMPLIPDIMNKDGTPASRTPSILQPKHNTSRHHQPKQPRKLRSAPRYATAIFRFSCCTLSTTWAILHFHGANFWPASVGGTNPTAQTKNCWDLSGSVAGFGLNGVSSVGMKYSLDDDFDHQNSSLRYFFLGQASYQMHSLCFHALSMVLLALYGSRGSWSGGGCGSFFASVRTSMKSYIKPIAEHLLSITLIMSSFLFSGTRRLGAIAIFALETSSLFLQLLQICINAPIGSRLRRPRTIRIVHRFLTIPVFVYCRFFVVPFVVLYSAVVESKDWIRQIERAMAPGCGALIYYFFNGLLLVVVGLTFVHMRRLLFHPHVRQILS